MATSMFRTNFNKSNRITLLRHKRQLQSTTLQETNGEDAHYPPVKPKYPAGRWGRMKPKVAWSWEGQREKVAALGTANEKLQLLTEKTYRTWQYNTVDPTPNLLKYQCGVTKTRIIKDDLPELYTSVALEDDFYERLKRIVTDTIIHEHEMNRQRIKKKTRQYDLLAGTRTRDTTEYNLSNLLVKSIFINLLGASAGQREDITESHVDYNATVSAFWSRYGILRNKLFVPSKDRNYVRQNNSMYYGEHTVEFQVRKRKPLPQFISTSDEICHLLSNRKYRANKTIKINKMRKVNKMEGISPKQHGQFMEKMPRKVTAGYNIGDAQLFNHLSIIFTNKEKLMRMVRYGDWYKTEADIGYAMNTGFLSTLAQAHMLGFNEHEELTYPFTTQTILTDGRRFILSTYQLNTIQLWKDNQVNRLQNICWVTPGKDLYETYENGQLVGFNDDLFRKLLKFFLIEPSDRDGIDLSPYLKQSPDMLTKIDIPNRKIYRTVEEEIEYDN